MPSNIMAESDSAPPSDASGQVPVTAAGGAVASVSPPESMGENPAPAGAATSTAPGSGRRTLLVVDDQPSVCAAVAYFLETCGYRTFRAESGQAALVVLGQELIDGILLDVQMPRLNGFETCRRLHELARAANRQLKIWFMTGLSYRGLKEDCIRAGGLAVFQKPFEWPELLAEIEKGLADTPGATTTERSPASPPGT
jgi:CheY-like chemotaxis protein